MVVEELVPLLTQDGVRVALWQVRDTSFDTAKRNVFLTHGTFSDKRICLGISKYLAAYGYTCWILEWRGHGASQQDVASFDFETVALFDVAAALRYLADRLGTEPFDCITHSGGGIALAMCLSRNSGLRPHIRNVVLFSCQACHAGFSFPRIILLHLMKLASRIAGHVPGKALGIGIQDESYAMMRQWYDWNITRRFNGHDDFDYLIQIGQLHLPVLAVFGGGDRFISPPQACRQYLSAFYHPQRRELYCAVPEGFSQNFGHADVLHSTAAKSEIWPLVRTWIEGDKDGLIVSNKASKV